MYTSNIFHIQRSQKFVSSTVSLPLHGTKKLKIFNDHYQFPLGSFYFNSNRSIILIVTPLTKTRGVKYLHTLENWSISILDRFCCGHCG